MSKLTYEQLQDVVYSELVRVLDYRMPHDAFCSVTGLMPRSLETILAQYFFTGDCYPSSDAVVNEIANQYINLCNTGCVDVVPEN